jgi:hypothetical protein
VPASRSRTERWRDCLTQIHARNGGVEFAIDHAPAAAGEIEPPDVMWRVRVLALGDKELLVERPSALTQPFDLAPGVGIVVVMSIGQNRWMFRSRVMGLPGDPATPFRNRIGGLRLELPESVERCSRREFMRTNVASLTLPRVEGFPILDPTSVAPAEAANEALYTAHLMAGTTWQEGSHLPMPVVGPSFTAQLMNLGGGGVGLQVDKTEAGAVDRARYMWLRLHLPPHLPAPLCVVGKAVHTHMDSSQNLYVGVAFDFALNTSHQAFVMEQMRRYAERIQGNRTQAA